VVTCSRIPSADSTSAERLTDRDWLNARRDPVARRHFQIEEEILFPAWAETAAAYDEAMVIRALLDHHAIRLAARRIVGGRMAPEELLVLGERLDAHVRFEERELLPGIESSLSAEALGVLAAELERAEADLA